ncbi:MAG: PKD domain-containing protein [Prevotella sp.]|nr:PKD domain-containing protein [Prevotella sp.]
MKKSRTYKILWAACLFVFSSLMVQAQELIAVFSAEEASTTYYEQGWDSAEEYNTWTYTSKTGSSTWALAERPYFSGAGTQEPFSKLELGSVYSLAIAYSNSAKDEQAMSPEITIRPNSTVEYYLCLYAVWYYNADLKFYIRDVETGKDSLLVSTFMWAQEHGYTGPNWEKFSFDLSACSGKKVQFLFSYVGAGGENVYIDGFRLREKNTSAEAAITIFEGEEVHFLDNSSGVPTAWNWAFEGGTPATSTNQNPVVRYNRAGTYPVKLTVSNATKSATSTREAYVQVLVKAPTALIGVPQAGYYSPWVYSFVPTNVPVQYQDLSSGNPTSWEWTFEGAEPTTSTEQNPVVVYKEQGVYGLTLDVANDAGKSGDFLKNAIQAGGSQDIWNITPEETADLGQVSLGWYGYYAGTNWLGMQKFAEKFSKPLVSSTIDKVSVYFATTTTVTPDSPITVSLCKAGADGMPGEELASTTLKASELVYDAQEVVPTVFTFGSSVVIDSDFFIVVEGFPNNATDAGTDDISVLCVLRNDGERTSTYHYLEDEDAQGNRLGTFQWFRNEDSPLSMAVTPTLTYQSESADILSVSSENCLQLTGETLLLPFDSAVQIYSLNGVLVKSVQGVHGALPLSDLPAGTYLVKVGNKVLKFVRK